MMARMFLADPSLITMSGHCFRYLHSLVNPAREAGYLPILIGNRGVEPEIVAQHNVQSMFTYWCDARFGSPEETAQVHRTAILADLRGVVELYGMNCEDVLILNTLRHWPLEGVIDWLEEIPASSRPFVCLILHFTSFPVPGQSDGTVEFYRKAFARLEASQVRHRVALFADSAELVQEYEAVNGSLPFLHAPIPHTPEDDALPSAEGDVTVGYVGEARVNKGFHLLPYMIHRVSESEFGASVHFHIQSFCFDTSQTFYRKVVDRLTGPRLTLYPNRMNDAEYGEYIRKLDVILIPYTLENYHSQTSGVLAEAMSHGKLVVVPRGTWMARQVALYGGGQAFNPSDAEDLAGAVLRTLGRRHDLTRSSEARRDAWRSFHNGKNFLRLVLEARPDSKSSAAVDVREAA